MANAFSLQRILVKRSEGPVLLESIPPPLREWLPRVVAPSVLNLNIFCTAQQFTIDQSGAPVILRTHAPGTLQSTETQDTFPLEIFFMAQTQPIRTIRTTALGESEEKDEDFRLGDDHFNTEGRIFNVCDPGNSVLSRFTFIIAISRHGSAACLRLLPKSHIGEPSELTFEELYIEVTDRRRQGRNPNASMIRVKDGMTLQDDTYIDVQRSFDVDFKNDRVQACGSLEGEALTKMIKIHLKRYPRH